MPRIVDYICPICEFKQGHHLVKESNKTFRTKNHFKTHLFYTHTNIEMANYLYHKVVNEKDKDGSTSM